MENLKALSYISKKFKIPLKDIGYCGLKDRHAITLQYITLPTKYGVISLNEENLKVGYLKTIGNPLKLGQLMGNKFKITLRNIKRENFLKIGDNLRNLHLGVPNYYDNQRFGSVFQNRIFIAKEYMMENYEDALKIILTKYKKSENKRIKDLKRYINENWGHWESILRYIKNNKIKNKMFVNIIKYLNNGDKDNNSPKGDYEERFKGAFKYVDNRLKKLFVLAYQSYLWNESIKSLLKSYIPKEDRVYVDYNCGSLLIYKNIDEDILHTLKNKTFPTITHDINLNNFEEDYNKIIKSILKKEGLKIGDFNKLKDFSNPSYSERIIISIPENISYGKFLKDELNRGKYKITMEFQLKKGSYATMIIKRIMMV
ncbi:tRNA pseudouridine(13) synthase TruD [Methanothermococcus sp. SCGC AD-155-C09]|nr:tRNA pseudouridine(13) synthase TruD [Methanothermococcus sp. SCGC AD-155-C09]